MRQPFSSLKQAALPTPMPLATGIPISTKQTVPCSHVAFGVEAGRSIATVSSWNLEQQAVPVRHEKLSPGGRAMLGRAKRAVLVPAPKLSTAQPKSKPCAEPDLTTLMSDIQRGVASAFDQLYVLTRPKLLRCILRIERDTAEAEDILQDVYIRIWSSSNQFDASKGSVDMWLAGIARNMALDRVRRRQARPKTQPRIDDTDPYEFLASSESGPMERAIKTQSAEAVQRCLALLRPSHREVLMLAFWSSLTHAEIAEFSGHPLGTIKSWVFRALRDMRKGIAPMQIAA